MTHICTHMSVHVNIQVYTHIHFVLTTHNSKCCVVILLLCVQFESGHKVRNGYVSVGDLEHCIHYKVGE